MTLQQLAKQLNIPAKILEKESLKAYLLAKLGENETKRLGVLKKYGIVSTKDWDEKAQEGKLKEAGYQGIADYFKLDELDWKKTELIKDVLSFS